MTSKWNWLAAHLFMAVVALALGGIIGEFALFRHTTLGTQQLTASAIVRFLSYAGALYLVWLTAGRAAGQLRDTRGRPSRSLAAILPPFAALLVAAGAYAALLVVLRPFLGEVARNTYDWLFVLAIAGTALWFATTAFQHAQHIVDLLPTGAADADDADPERCGKCRAELADRARYCHRCGAAA